MSVVIRLSKTGKTHNISYRITVSDKWSKKEGKYVEQLGFYNPFQRDGDRYKINKERYGYWLSQGAKPSSAVQELVEGNGTRPVKPKKPRKDAEAKAAATQAPPPTKPAEEKQLEAEAPAATE